MTGTNHHVRALAKGLAILELLSGEGNGLPLADVSRRLGFNRSTTHHLLATLREYGFVDQDADSKDYRLGYRLVGLVNQFVADAAVSSVGIGPVKSLRDLSGHTVFLTALQGWELFVIYEAAGIHPIHTGRRKQSGQTFLHATASGKTLLAHLADNEISEFLARVELTAFTSNTITSTRELETELNQIRVNGLTLDREEFLLGIRSVAAPVFDREGACVATVSIAYPAIQADREAELMVSVSDAAVRISTALGFFPTSTDPGPWSAAPNRQLVRTL